MVEDVEKPSSEPSKSSTPSKSSEETSSSTPSSESKTPVFEALPPPKIVPQENKLKVYGLLMLQVYQDSKRL